MINGIDNIGNIYSRSMDNIGGSMGGRSEKPVVVWQKKVNWLYITNEGIYESSAGPLTKILTPIIFSPYTAFIRNKAALKGIVYTRSSHKNDKMTLLYYNVLIQYLSDGDLTIYV